MKWIKCSDKMPENTGDPIIFRKNWNYATAKAMIPVSAMQIMGTFNSELKYVEWLDESDNTESHIDEWVSCDFALPPKSMTVRWLCIDGKEDVGHWNGKFFGTWDMISDKEITHWKPI